MTSDRYTSEARRAIVFALDASRQSAPEIGTMHLLWGVMREDPAFVNRFLTSKATVESMRDEALGESTPSMSPRIHPLELRFSAESQRVLSFATEEADREGRANIGIDHLLLGLMHEYDSDAERILSKHGASLERARSELDATPYQSVPAEERARTERKNIDEIFTKLHRLARSRKAAGGPGLDSETGEA